MNTKENRTLSIAVINVFGEIVYNSTTQNVATGSYITPIDLSNNANGVYFTNITVNGKDQSIKINVAK
ncbi:MAG: T9SS type A sorting domain-containing protein [Flavobacteriales bacterium]|nr:T9SS type A sorting domain-containing protein [Flavobacteriales bacterium]